MILCCTFRFVVEDCKHICTTLRQFSTEIGDHLQVYHLGMLPSHPGQLILAIPSWVGTMSTSESWVINRHTVRCTSLVSVVSPCKLMWLTAKETEISTALWALWLEKTLRHYVSCVCFMFMSSASTSRIWHEAYTRNLS